MYSNNLSETMKRCLQLASMVVFLFPANIKADQGSTKFSVRPARCIALHQGQTCYATLKFQWKTPRGSEYCLFDTRLDNPLLCWKGRGSSEHRLEFASDKNVSYEIRDVQSQQTLSDALVKISWVYKSNRKATSRWRLF